MATKYAGVYLLDAPFSLDREYDYMIPEGINITPGDFVGLPFGNGNRRRIALVTSIKDTTEVALSALDYSLHHLGRHPRNDPLRRTFEA